MISIFHSKNFRDTSFYGHPDIITRDKIIEMLFNDGYELVADVDTDDLDMAYQLTNHITSNWLENKEVTKYPDIEKARSTSIGDLMIREGQIWIVEPCGFDLIGDYGS